MGMIATVSSASTPDARDGAAARTSARRIYLRVLTLAFTVLNSVRLVSYLPTLWSIHLSRDSSQHSLLTWAIWVGANATMAAWLYEQTGHRINPATAVCLGNAVMCAACSALIVWYRL